MVNEDMNVDFLLAVYFQGDSRYNLIVAKKISISFKDILDGNWMIDQSHSVLRESHPNSWVERYAVLKHYNDKRLFISFQQKKWQNKPG